MVSPEEFKKQIIDYTIEGLREALGTEDDMTRVQDFLSSLRAGLENDLHFTEMEVEVLEQSNIDCQETGVGSILENTTVGKSVGNRIRKIVEQAVFAITTKTGVDGLRH